MYGDPELWGSGSLDGLYWAENWFAGCRGFREGWAKRDTRIVSGVMSTREDEGYGRGLGGGRR